MAFAEDPWLVQAVGELDDFFCVSFLHPLREAEALGEGGHPRARPLGDVRELLAGAAPALLEHNLVDGSQEQPSNVFDTYLFGGTTTVKAGVRVRFAEPGAAADGHAYHYGVRIDVDLAANRDG